MALGTSTPGEVAAAQVPPFLAAAELLTERPVHAVLGGTLLALAALLSTGGAMLGTGSRVRRADRTDIGPAIRAFTLLAVAVASAVAGASVLFPGAAWSPGPLAILTAVLVVSLPVAAVLSAGRRRGRDDGRS